MDTAPLSTNDVALLSWLNAIPTEPREVDIKVEDHHVKINCRNDYLALKLWSQHDQVQSFGFTLEVRSNGELIDSTKRMNQTTSTWATQHRLELIDMGKLCTVSIHGESAGYPYLAVQPFLNNEAVLNKPIKELLGQPLNVVASEIAAAKLHCIQRAIANGDIASETYKFEWQGIVWGKQVTAIYLSGCQEIMTKTSHAQGEEWQIGFWRNHLKSLSQS